MRIHNPEPLVDRPSCIMLDLDNTFYAYAPCHEAGLAAASELARDLLSMAKADFERCLVDARAEIKARLDGQAASHNRLLYFQRTLERAGLATRPLEALQLNQAYWLAYLDTMALFPGALDFLDDLRLAGVPAIVVTDLTVEIQLRKMIVLGLDAHIDWLVSSEESGHDKPHPASFELALAKMGGVEGPVWMVGDNASCDMVGAKAAVGAVTIHFAPDDISTGSASIDASVSSFASLRKLLAKALSS